MQAAKELGATVFAIDPRPMSLDLAVELGADATINPQTEDLSHILNTLTGGVGPDIVIDAAGSNETTALPVDLVRRGGHVVLVAIYTSKPEFDFNTLVSTTEVRVSGSLAYQQRDVEEAVRLIAEGKIKVALNKGEELPENAIIDGHGRPTTSPEAFYREPVGAILTIAGHKGYGLSVLCEVLAGSLTGGGSSHPDNPNAKGFLNSMMSIYLDPDKLVGEAFAGDIERLIGWVKASPPLTPGGKILMPGEPEEAIRTEREAGGIPLDDMTWTQILDTAQKLGLDSDAVEAIVARAA